MGTNATLPSITDLTVTQSSAVIDLTKVRVRDGSTVRLAASSSTPFWANAPGVWDNVTLGRFVLPGVCAVKGKIARRKDRKKITGIAGNVLTDVGAAAAEINVQLRMWTPQHWDDFKELALMIRPGPNSPPPKAFDIAHPAVSVFGIKSVELLSATLPYRLSDNTPDIYACDLVLVEANVDGAKATAKVNTNTASQTLGNVLKDKTNQSVVPASFAPRKPSDRTQPNASFNP